MTRVLALAISSSLVVWELNVTGHDAIALSAVIATLFLLAQRAFSSPKRWPIYAVAGALGVFGTARIIFPFIAPLIGLLYVKSHTKKAVVFTLVATAITAALHGYHFSQNDYYDPLHLFGRAENNMGHFVLLLGTIATAIIGLLALVKSKDNSNSKLQWFILCFSTPLLFISFGELYGVRFNIAIWEGSNYLLPIMMTVAYYCIVYHPPQAKDENGITY